MLPVATSELKSDFLLFWYRVDKKRLDGQRGIFEEVEFLLQEDHIIAFPLPSVGFDHGEFALKVREDGKPG